MKRTGYLPFVSLYLLLSAALCAQDFSLLGDPSRKKRSGDQPTVIFADTMDIDSSKNLAVFTGNVKVEDQELKINCHKMTIYLEDTVKDGEEAKAKPEGGGDIKKSKGVSKIFCEGDVVIVRKPPENETDKEEQKANSGKAEYDIKEGKIVLSENPVLMQGEQKIAGDRITVFRDTEKMIVEGGKQGATMFLKSNTLNPGDDGSTNKDKKE